jgi:hypothetical protein
MGGCPQEGDGVLYTMVHKKQIAVSPGGSADLALL